MTQRYNQETANHALTSPFIHAQVRSLLSTQNDTYLPQWTPDENADASDEE